MKDLSEFTIRALVCTALVLFVATIAAGGQWVAGQLTSPATMATLTPVLIAPMSTPVLLQTYEALPSLSLINAAPREIAQRAVDDTRTVFDVLGPDVTVVLVRDVRAEELPELGMPGFGPWVADLPLVLVVVRGDFDLRRGTIGTSRLDPDRWHWRVPYIAYVIDRASGMTILTQTSSTGGRFRIALNDPSLPDESPKVPETRVGPPLAPAPDYLTATALTPVRSPAPAR